MELGTGQKLAYTVEEAEARDVAESLHLRQPIRKFRRTKGA